MASAPSPVSGAVAGWYRGGCDQRWGTTADLLAHMSGQERRQHRAELNVAIMPSPFQISSVDRTVIEHSAEAEDFKIVVFLETPDRPQRMLLEFCGARAIPCIGLTPNLHRVSLDQPVYFLAKGHLNEAGPRIVAQALYDHILRKGQSSPEG